MAPSSPAKWALLLQRSMMTEASKPGWSFPSSPPLRLSIACSSSKAHSVGDREPLSTAVLIPGTLRPKMTAPRSARLRCELALEGLDIALAGLDVALARVEDVT